MRDDARAGTKRLQLRNQLLIQPRHQEERDDGRVAEIGFEQILIHEPDAARDAGSLRVVAGLGHEPRLELDADRARAVALRRPDRNPSVAGAEVVDDVGGGHVRELEHRVDDALRARDVLHVRRSQSLLRSQRRSQRRDEDRDGDGESKKLHRKG